MAFTVTEDYKEFEKYWKNLGFTDWPGRQPANLTNPINPIFMKSFRGMPLFWGTDSEYEMLKPALRLASAFLTTPASLLFIYSVVYERRKKLPSQFDTMHVPNSQIRRTKERNPTIILRRMRRVFTQAAVYNQWGPGDDSYFDADSRGSSSAEELDEFSAEQGPRLRSDGRIGLCTSFSFNRTYLKWIKRLHAEGRQNSLQMLATQFYLAITLSHESIHTINYANSWENEVFGGVVRDDNLKDFDRPIIGWVNEWPGRSTLKKEVGRNVPEWPYVAAGLMPSFEEDIGLEERYFISMHYIHAVQQQSNWELFLDQWDLVKKNFDTELNIKIPKGIGFRGEWSEGRWGNLIKDEIRYRHPIPRAICSAEDSEQAFLERKNLSRAAAPMQDEFKDTKH